MSYQPIENYGIIGDMHTVALVGLDGSIDWLCYPHFDSPSVFAAVLDDAKGGRFRICPVDSGGVKRKQFYWPETNVLVTRFLSGDGVAEVIDFMPVGEDERTVVRLVNVLRGSMKMRVECQPAFNYARDEHTVEVTPHGACFYSPNLSLGLSAKVELRQEGPGVVGEFVVDEEQPVTFVLQGVPQGAGCALSMPEEEAQQQFENTVAYWRGWVRSRPTEAAGGRW